MTQAFNLSQLANNVNTSGQLNAASGLYNQVPVANGGTGASTLTSGAVLLGSGTSAITTVSAATSGNVLTANGTTWVSQAASGGTPVVTIYTSPATWTKPATIKAVKVTMMSGGGGGSSSSPSVAGSGGGGGAYGLAYFTGSAIPGPQSITTGSGGAGGAAGPTNPGVAGGTASFGTLVTATGGGGGISVGAGGAGGVVTPSPAILGLPGLSGSAGAPTLSGNGGNSALVWGIGGASVNPVIAGNPSTYGYGGGGGGAGTRNPSFVGGNGASGFVIVEEFY